MWCNGLAQGSVEPQDRVQFPVSAPSSYIYTYTMTFKQARGVQDSAYGKEILRQKVISIIREIYEKNGFNPLQTPTIERFETLTNKFAGGEEIINEIYTFTDQGDRKLGLRYDHTVPLARFISQDRSIKLPFKRYQIGKVFRDGPVKKGRLREFYQCDADIVGSKSIKDEATLIKMVSQVFARLNITYIAQINNRKILDDVMDSLNIPVSKRNTCILSIDKLEKQGRKYVIQELIDKGLDEKIASRLLDLLSNDLESLKDVVCEENYDEVNTLLTLLERYRVNYVFKPELARGLQYYTGSIFEFFFVDKDITSSIAAGGRYDDMIGDFIQDNQKYPSVGISIGLDVILEVLNQDKKSVVDVFVIPIGVDVHDQVKELRSFGLNVDVNPENRGISSGFKFAEYYGIDHVLLIGSDELDSGLFTLKNIKSGKEKKVSLKDLASLV